MGAVPPADDSATDWATRLTRQEGRAGALSAFARASGANVALLLACDPDNGAMLPVAGTRQTLPAGDGWRGLLHSIRQPGVTQWALEALEGDAMQPAVASSNGEVALVLVGGEPDTTMLAQLAPLWPLIAAAVACEQRSRALTGELRTARSEMRQFAALAQTLGETRTRLDGTIRELGEQARRAEEAGRAKDEFLAMLGHELRNPLSPIVVTLEVLRRRDAWRPELDVIQRQVEHMQRLVEDLLDVSRIARGRLTLNYTPLELGDILARAREAGPLWSRKRQHLHWQVPDIGLPVIGDRARLTQVFTNLLDNAAKYSGQGAQIHLQAQALDGVARVTVRDDGIGMAPGQLEQVFEMFEQGQRSIAGSSGLGLGLAIVRNLVRQHGGQVWAESEGPGRGSAFKVELPLAAAHGGSHLAPVPHAPVADPIRARVLLVDDNADARDAVAVLLRLDECEVLGVGSGAEALAQAAAFSADVAVLDLGMPDIDGLTLARRLREELGDRTPRLVALTGFGQQSDRTRAKAAGFDAFLVKPADPALLQETIRRLASAADG